MLWTCCGTDIKNITFFCGFPYKVETCTCELLAPRISRGPMLWYRWTQGWGLLNILYPSRFSITKHAFLKNFQLILKIVKIPRFITEIKLDIWDNSLYFLSPHHLKKYSMYWSRYIVPLEILGDYKALITWHLHKSWATGYFIYPKVAAKAVSRVYNISIEFTQMKIILCLFYNKYINICKYTYIHEYFQIILKSIILNAVMTPVLKTSRRLLLWNIARYTFPNKAVSLMIRTGLFNCEEGKMDGTYWQMDLERSSV